MATSPHGMNGQCIARESDSLPQENEALRRHLEEVVERLADSEGREASLTYERYCSTFQYMSIRDLT